MAQQGLPQLWGPGCPLSTWVVPVKEHLNFYLLFWKLVS